MDIHNELKAMMDINLKTEFDLAINEVIEKSYQEDAKELGSKLALIVKSQWIQMKPYLFLAYCLGAKAQAVPEWISVENKLPKRNIKVLLNIVARRRGKPFSCMGFYSVEPDDEPCFILDDNFTILKGVTHWMQLPQAPKAQEPAND